MPDTTGRRHHLVGDLPPADVEQPQPLERQLDTPLVAHVACVSVATVGITRGATHQVERRERRRVGLAELDLRLGEHQEHVGVAHQDDVDAAVAAVRLVGEVDVLPDVEAR